MSIKLDLHVHSESRGKVFINAEQLKNSLKQNRIDGVAITNFFDISHALWLKEKIKEHIIIVGQEIWAKDGHIIGLALNRKINDFQSAEETIRHIHEQGGIAVAVHPFFPLGIGKAAMRRPFDAIEVYNAGVGASFIHNYLAGRMAEKMNIAQLSSSDTTNPKFIGRSFTEVMTDDKELILDTIRSANVRLFKKALPIPFVFILNNLLKVRNLEPCLTHAVPCFVCGKAMTVRLFKQRFKCIDCGKIEFSRIACCNGHYFCLRCVIERGAAISAGLQQENCNAIG